MIVGYNHKLVQRAESVPVVENPVVLLNILLGRNYPPTMLLLAIKWLLIGCRLQSSGAQS